MPHQRRASIPFPFCGLLATTVITLPFAQRWEVMREIYSEGIAVPPSPNQPFLSSRPANDTGMTVLEPAPSGVGIRVASFAGNDQDTPF